MAGSYGAAVTRTTDTTARRAKPFRSRWNGNAVLAVVGVASYALTLTIASDTFFLLAVPGMLGLTTVVIVAVYHTQRRPLPDVDVPADGARLGPVVRRHRMLLLRRYAAHVALAVVLCGVPFLVEVRVLYPLVGVGVLIAKIVHYVLFRQLALLRAMTRVLSVYEPGFRSPVRVVMRVTGGKWCVTVGEGEQRTARMVASGVVDHPAEPPALADGGWYAGDDALGGVLVVARTGETLCLVPQDGNTRVRERGRANAERQARERAAGLTGLTP